MQYNELKTTTQRGKTRVGRGISAGQGKTAGRGTKGQNARGDHKIRPGFEGGQNPLMRRVPKLPGFKSLTPKAFTVYTSHLKQVKGDTVDNFTLADAGILPNAYIRAKLVVNGDAAKKNVFLQGASKTAIELLQKAGGTFKQTDLPQRSAKEKSTK